MEDLNNLWIQMIMINILDELYKVKFRQNQDQNTSNQKYIGTE